MTEEKFIQDGFLQDALKALEINYFRKREILEENINFEIYKTSIEKIKQKSVANIGSYISTLINSLKKKNINVYLAKDSESADRIILEIIKHTKSNIVVKSKSLTTEEIDLNRFLKENNIDSFETDLGEWLVQIANDPSTHMTAPAIHMNREKIRNLLNEKFDANLPSDLDELVNFSKMKIRQHFNESRVGILGANVVTKDGLFFIVSNEGNVQHVLLNDVNICIVGVDKIVETPKEAFEIVDFLPKAATAQLATSYVDCFEKPPGEFNVILLDNGRIELSQNKAFAPILQCIRCGACQNACCVYTTVSGLLFRGKAYAGPIGILLSYAFGYEKLSEFANYCIGCMACDEICSSKIPIQSLILKIKSQYRTNPIIKDKILESLTNYNSLRLYIRIMSILFKKEIKFGVNYLDQYFGFDFRPLPKPNKKSFDLIKLPKSKIGLFAGCSINIFYENIGYDCLEVSKKLSEPISVIKQPSCCGAACYYNGKKQAAIKQAQNNASELENYEKVIFLDPHCEHIIKRDYYEMAGIDLKVKIIDANSYFLNEIDSSKIKSLNKKITYHHPCHLLRGLKTSNDLEAFLKKNEPDFIELNEKTRCCGFAGTYSIMHKGISNALLERKIKNIINSGAEILITACPGCIMQIEGGLRQKGSNIKVLHFISYLNSILEV